MAGKTSGKGKWIVDSGATEHITYDNSLIEKLPTERFESPVGLPNGDIVPIKGHGHHTLPNRITIKYVLHVPDFDCNILSRSKITNDLQCVATFFLQNSCHIGLEFEGIDWNECM